MLKSSVAEIATCVEDLQSNMIIVMSMLAQLSPQAEGTLEPEVRAQCQRMKALANIFCKPLDPLGVETNVTGFESALNSVETNEDTSEVLSHGLSKSTSLSAFGSSNVMGSSSPSVPSMQMVHSSSSHTPLKGPTRGLYKSPRPDGAASTPSLSTRVAHSPGPARTPCLPLPRCPMSPPVYHRSPSPMSVSKPAESAIRIAPPRDRIPQDRAPHDPQLPPRESVGCDSNKQQHQPPPWDPRSNLRAANCSSFSVASENLDAIQQPSWGWSPGKELLDTAPPVCFRSPALSTRQLAEFGPSRKPRRELAELMCQGENQQPRVAVQVDGSRSPMMSHRGVDSQNTPRDAELAPWMRSRGGMCTPMPSAEVIVATCS